MQSLHAAGNACNRAALHVEIQEPERDAATTSWPGGDPLTVVLCHGFGGSARNFRPQTRALGGAVRFVLFDARGHARSAKPQSKDDYHLCCLVDDLATVIGKYAPGRVLVGGISLGAAVALRYAIQSTSRVSGLLLASYPSGNAEWRRWTEQFAEFLDKFGMEEAGERFVWGTKSRFDPKTRELIKLGFLEHAPSAMSGLLRHGLAEIGTAVDLAAELRTLALPTRIVVGSEDTPSLEPSRQLATLIPGATLSVLEGAGHVVNLVRVAEFNEQLRMLVAQVAP